MQIICGGLDRFYLTATRFSPLMGDLNTHPLQGTMGLALANVVLASTIFTETGEVGLCPGASTVSMKWTGSGQPTGWVRREWSLRPGAKATPASLLSSAGPPRPKRAVGHCLFVTELKLTAHTISPLFSFLSCKICFLGCCPISLPGNPTPIRYNASGEVAPLKDSS